jgi:acyl-CoA thioesterase
MTTLAAILAGLTRDGDVWHSAIPDNWLQGRTAYGGLSTALALHAAQHSDTDLPAPRSAQVAFVGPLSGNIAITASRLRRGRNAAWIQADVTSEAGLGLRATFVFMGPVASAVDHQVGGAPDFPAPGPDTRVYNGFKGINFTQNFELLDKREGTGPAEWLRWVRLTERDGLDPMIELVAIADCLPPAALKLVGGPAPVSSMTWQLNLLGPTPRTRDGWWLLRAAADYAKDGSSSQSMGIWNTDGTPVAEQVQSVAIFA